MDLLGHELLLLMLNLSRMKDREMILRLFVEALSTTVRGVRVRRLSPGEAADGEIEEVATPDAHFGRVVIEDPGHLLSERDRGRFRNAVRMLAVVLENNSRAERLATENARLDAAVAARTADLRRALQESEALYQERLRVEKALRESEERYRQSQKLEAIGRLAGGIAHDFNNLLTAILGCSDLLLESLPEGDPLRDEAATILDAGMRAAALTKQLLAFGRRHPTAPTLVDLGETVAGMEKMLRRLIGEDVEVKIARAPGLGHVLADRGQMEQVVLNLAVNARDAMPRGGELRIATANVENTICPCGAPGSHVMLSVSDTGVGMSPEVQAHLFEPFFTTKAQGKGTGLGLATVYGIVTQAGGSIRVRSAPGEGTCFDVCFPPAVCAAASDAPSSREVPLPGTETILLVDDEPLVRAVASRLLRDAGYTVIEAEDGERALEIAARAERLDVVVIDVVMPRMSGAATSARLREMKPGVSVVFMSGYIDEARLSEALLPGTPLLEKPFTAYTLTKAIRRELDARPASTEIRDVAPTEVAPPLRG